jgi:hypothetical protein
LSKKDDYDMAYGMAYGLWIPLMKSDLWSTANGWTMDGQWMDNGWTMAYDMVNGDKKDGRKDNKKMMN